VIAELHDLPAAVLVDVAGVRAALHSALSAAGADVRQVVSEQFAPQGATAVAVLAESHASVHTWPEHGMAFVDVFTCGGDADPVQAVKLLADALGAGRTSWTVLDRGGPPRTVREQIGDRLRREWDLGTVHWAGDTGFQHVQIADTAHGVTLFCDGERQSAELSQLVYHEALFLPAALLADRCANVLVIGSSEGVVSHLAMACGAARVDHVDIDRTCVRACAEHLPYGYTPEELAAAEHVAEHGAEGGAGPVRVHYADGAAYLADGDTRWDVIVVDLPDENDDPAAQHNRLYAPEFLRECASRLRPGGVLASQAGCPTMWRNAGLRAALRRFRDVFGTVVYQGSDEQEWAFLFGRTDRLDDPVGRMVDRLGSLSYPPATLDAAALRAHAVPPHGLRARNPVSSPPSAGSAAVPSDPRHSSRSAGPAGAAWSPDASR
jgi:spermidine synthase